MELDVEKPVEATPKQTPNVEVPAEESDVQVVEAPLVKKRKLRREAESIAPEVEPAMPVVETAAPVVKMANVVTFLAARRGEAPSHSVPRVKMVAAFLANELIPTAPINVVGLVEEPLRAPDGPIPSMLNRPLGSNIQHILEDLEMGSEESVGVAEDNLGWFAEAVGQAPQGPLSTIPEARVSSRAPTPKRSRSLTLVQKASVLKRLRVSEASETSESTTEIQPEGANWTFRGRLAKFGRDLKGNPSKAVLDMVDHQNLQLKNRDVSTRGMAEEMLALHFLVSNPILDYCSCGVCSGLMQCSLLVVFPQVDYPLLLFQEGLGR
jgi:hypothetical protein